MKQDCKIFGSSTAADKDKMLFQLVSELAATFNTDEIWQE